MRSDAPPPNVALMRLAMAAESEASFARALERAPELRRLAETTPDLWSLVRAVLASVADAEGAGVDLGVNLSTWAAAFDRAAAVSPEGSVALYALGRPDLLEFATGEVVELMRELRMIGEDRALLDIGCGVGRFEVALSGMVGRILGLDISPAMIEAARRRSAGLSNVELSLYSGRELGLATDGGFHGVLAIDSFPYIVAAAPSLPELFFGEVARVLAPGGDFLIINYAYGRDDAADAAEVASLADRVGFATLRAGDRPFRHWDGRVFHLRKRG